MVSGRPRDPDAELLERWDDLCSRLTWQYGIEEAKRRYEALADGTDSDLIRWRARGLTEDA
jgi:hypothetical protein